MKNIKDIIIIILLIIIGVFIWWYLNLNVDNNNKNNNEDEFIDLPEPFAAAFNNCVNNYDSSCEVKLNNISYNNKETSFEYIKSYINSNRTDYLVKINDKTVKDEEDNIGGLKMFLVANDMIFIGYNWNSNIDGDVLEIYDFEGNLIYEMEYINKDKYIRLYSWEIKDNKLYITGTRGYHDNNVLYNDEGEGADICSNEELEVANISLDDYFTATYEVKYLGNYQFIEPLVIEDSIQTIEEIREEYCK